MMSIKIFLSGVDVIMLFVRLLPGVRIPGQYTKFLRESQSLLFVTVQAGNKLPPQHFLVFAARLWYDTGISDFAHKNGG